MGEAGKLIFAGPGGQEESRKRRLIEGAVFKKLHKFGTSKSRHVWCSQDLRTVYWGKQGKSSVTGEMPTQELLEVQEHEFMDKGGRNPKRFHLIFRGGRAVTLEATSQAERDSWVASFRYAKEVAGRQKLADHDKLAHTSAMVGHDNVKREDLFQLLRMLVTGATMNKYARRRSNKRFIWCPLCLDQVLYGADRAARHAGGSGPAKSKLRGVSVLDVVNIRSGKTTDHFSSSAAEARCFSVIITGGRTIDLEAESKEMRDRWVQGLHQVVTKLSGCLSGTKEAFFVWYAQQPDMDFGGSDSRIVPCIPQVSALEAGDSGSALVRTRSATFAGSRAASSSQAARLARGEAPPKPTSTAGTTETAGSGSGDGGGSSGDDN